MIKTAEQEQQLKLAIRDVVGRNPLISVVQLQNALKERGFKTADGNPLDWRYVAKLVRKLNREKALAVDLQKVNERLAQTKERYRLIIQRLWKMIDYKDEYLKEGIFPPKNEDVVRAANTILKMDLAILKAEMDAGIFDRKLGTVDVNLNRFTVLPPEMNLRIIEAFSTWGINLNPQRPQAIQAPANGSDPDSGRSLPAAP